jgi:hypothetical protein
VFFLAHLIATNDVFVALTKAAEPFALPLRWTTERDLRRDLAGERIDGTTDLVPIPDAHAIVEHDGIEYSFAIELDRGTVEEKRIRKKIKAYGAWTPSAGYRRRFPEASLRVLFVVAAGTGSARRLERLRRWCEDEGGRSLFWFLEHSRVDERILFGRVWHVAGQRELRALLAPPVNLALPSLRTVSP